MMSDAQEPNNEEYVQQGFVGPLDILALEDARLALHEVMEEDRRNPLYESNNRFKLHLFLPRTAAIAFHPKLVAAVRKALYPQDQLSDVQEHQPVLLWSSDVNIKPGKSPGYFALHQDSAYAGLEPATDCVTAWVALSDPVGMNEGCLIFYPGSHRLGQLEHSERPREVVGNSSISSADSNSNNMLSMGQYIPERLIQEKLNMGPRPIPLRAGQATLHSFRCVHASGPNHSDDPRVGLALRYMAGHVRQTKPVRELVTLICGKIPPNDLHFDLEPNLPVITSDGTTPSCCAEDVQRGKRVRREAMRREDANYFQKATSELNP